ncbi:MAG: bacterioferritin-associated ferredoxin [Thermoproteota archaeon]|jgi:bacterioferritin-associated ferredoxin
MYVCICKGITEKQVLDEVQKSRSTSTKEICRRLGVGTDCGTCLYDSVDLIIQNHLQSHSKSLPVINKHSKS